MKIGKKRKPFEALDIVSFIILTLMVIIIIFPFYTSVLVSFTTNISYVRKPVQFFPESFTLENYSYVIDRMNIFTGYKNTLTIVIIGTALTMFISLTYSYALAMRDYPGKKFFFILLLITMYFGGGLIPTYLLLRDLKLINNVLAIVFICGVSPFNIIIMKNGIEALPESLDEAARVAGANEWQIFTKITIPLIKPIVVTFSLFAAVGYWNEWYWSMITLTKTSVKTLQIMLRAIVDSTDALEMDISASDFTEVFNQGMKMAAVVLTMLPIMVVYPFLQKHFAAGILVGAVKM